MGKETSRIIKHNLTTSDIHELAEELSVIFKKNVSYGYNLTFEWEKFKVGEDPSYDYVEQGIANYKGAESELKLTKENYCYELFLNQYGEETLNDSVFNTEEGGWKKEDILNSKKELWFDLNDWEAKYESVAQIYFDSLFCWLSDERTYWWFCTTFAFKDSYEMYYPDIDCIEGLRYENYELVQSLYGSCETLIFCIENHTHEVDEWARNKIPFDEIILKTKEKFGNEFLNISEFMLENKSETLPMSPDSIPHGTENREQLVEELTNSVPQVFLDDYKDIIGTKKPEPTPPLALKDWFIKPLDEITKEIDTLYSTGCGTENNTETMNSNQEHLTHFDIAGFTYYKGAKCFNKLKIGKKLKLKLEPENKFDARAVAVYYKKNKLGFVPRSDNRIIYKLLSMNLGSFLEARVQAVNKKHNPESQVQVVVHLIKNEEN